MDDFPYTSNGKIDKRALKQMALDKVAQDNAEKERALMVTKPEFYSPIKLLSDVTPDNKMDSVRLLISEKENLDPNYVILWIVRFYGV